MGCLQHDKFVVLDTRYFECAKCIDKFSFSTQVSSAPHSMIKSNLVLNHFQKKLLFINYFKNLVIERCYVTVTV